MADNSGFNPEPRSNEKAENQRRDGRSAERGGDGLDQQDAFFLIRPNGTRYRVFREIRHPLQHKLVLPRNVDGNLGIQSGNSRAKLEGFFVARNKAFQIN
jgi:hypothetical protein